jgi:hypothetical protein
VWFTWFVGAALSWLASWLIRTLSRRTFLGRRLALAARWRPLLPAMTLRDEVENRSLSIVTLEGKKDS